MRKLRTKNEYTVNNLSSVNQINEVLREFAYDTYTDFNEFYRVWDDLQFEASADRLYSVAGNIDYDYTDGGIIFNKAASNSDYVTYIVQMPHKWAQGTNIRPHIHWIQTTSGLIPWTINYRWYNNGEAVPSFLSTPLAYETHSTFPYTSGSILQLTQFPEIEAEGKEISSFLDIRISRNGQGGLNGDVLLKQFDIHILIDSNGSRDEYIKEQ